MLTNEQSVQDIHSLQLYKMISGNNRKKNQPSYFIILNLLRWMDDLRYFVIFKSISVISGRWADDNERLFAIDPS